MRGNFQCTLLIDEVSGNAPLGVVDVFDLQLTHGGVVRVAPSTSSAERPCGVSRVAGVDEILCRRDGATCVTSTAVSSLRGPRPSARASALALLIASSLRAAAARARSWGMCDTIVLAWCHSTSSLTGTGGALAVRGAGLQVSRNIRIHVCQGLFKWTRLCTWNGYITTRSHCSNTSFKHTTVIDTRDVHHDERPVLACRKL